jgi:hypothetical protein
MEFSSKNDFRQRAGYDIEGVWYPRVTSIVAIKSKPALYRYYARMPNMRAADEAKNRSAEEGTRIHEAIEAVLMGSSPVLDEVTSAPVEAFTDFLRNSHVTPLCVEQRVVSTMHGYAGTVDVIAEVDGVIGVIDIKTSKSIYRDYGIQTAAYVTALREQPSLPQPTTSWILRIDQLRACSNCSALLRVKGGSVNINGKGSRTCSHRWGPVIGQLEFVECDQYERDFSAFLAAKHLWEWEYRSFLHDEE